MSQSKPVLHYFRYSPASKPLLLLIKHLGLDFDYHHVDTIAREQFLPEFLKLNPQHTVPILEDGPDIILDCNAICTYIVHRYASPAFASMAPTDPLGRAKVEQLQHFSDAKLFNLFYKMITDVAADGGANNGFHAEDIASTLDALGVLDAILSGHQFLCGQNLTVVDFACVSTATALLTLMQAIDVEGLDKKYPNLHGWIGRMAALLPEFDEIVVQRNDIWRQRVIEAKNRA